MAGLSGLIVEQEERRIADLIAKAVAAERKRAANAPLRREDAEAAARLSCRVGRLEATLEIVRDYIERGRAVDALQAIDRVGLPIPYGVYWSREAGNFYQDETNRGMGLAFYNRWQRRKDEFPEKATTVTATLDINLDLPVELRS